MVIVTILSVVLGLQIAIFLIFIGLNIWLRDKRIFHMAATISYMICITFGVLLFVYPEKEEPVKSAGFKFPQENNKPTYQIEIINQDSVYVLTDTGKVKTHIDSIGKIIIKDNL